MPRIALTKGRLLEPALRWLDSRGFSAFAPARRRLCLDLGRGWEALMLKGPDVAAFVQNGAADLGVLGSDVIEETRPDLYDLRALGFGRCRLSLAVPEEWKGPRGAGPISVATKYPRMAHRHLSELDIWARLIPLSSSVELAPQLGLSEAVVDLVDTGSTLEANGLREERVLAPVQAHLVANRGAYRFLQERWWEQEGVSG